MVKVTKSQLRQEIGQKLKAITPTQREAWSLAATENLLKLDVVTQVTTLLLFASLPTEIDTQPIYQRLHNQGKRLAFPKINSSTQQLTCHWVRAWEELIPGKFGIREPYESIELPLEQLDLIIVPGLAFDRQGNRLGRGQGFFDRLLSQTKPKTFHVGLFYAFQEVPLIPADTWDCSLSIIVTNQETLFFS